VRRAAGHLLLTGACLLASCRSDAAGELRNGLPAFARSVRVESLGPAEELPARVRELLRAAGFDGRGERIILTQPAPLGELSMRITVEVEGSTATASSEFAVIEAGEPLWRVARNAAGPGEAVFLRMVEVLGGLPHERVVYLMDP
jgi:hypothetical protein